jgi:hypothetical protein
MEDDTSSDRDDEHRADDQREVEPRDADDIADAAEDVDRLERHQRGFDDSAAINPRRSQRSSGDPSHDEDQQAGGPGQH